MGPVGDRYLALLRRYFAPQWPFALTLLVLLFGAMAVQLVQPRLLAGFINQAGAGAPVSALLHTAVAFLALAVAGQGVGMASAYLGERLGLTATNLVRVDLLRHCLGLDLSFHDQHGPGELIQRIDGDVASLVNFFSSFLPTMVGNGLLLVGVLVMITAISWPLGAALTAFSAAVLLLLYRLRTVASKPWERFMQAQAEQSAFLEEHLSATEDLRSSGATAYAMRRFFEHAREVFRRQMRAVLAGSAAVEGVGGLFSVGGAAGLAVAAVLFDGGRIAIGTVFLVFMYTQMLSAPLQSINRQVQDLQTATAAIARVSQLLATHGTMADGPGGAVAPGPLSVRLDGVAFAYGDDAPVLQDLSLRLGPGRVLGVLGRTGSGKTTLARLLLRFHDPVAGVVAVGGSDLRAWELSALRRRVGMVMQDVRLLRASVRDNLTLFNGSIADDRIAAVLREIGLGPWLDGLPAGLDTPVTSGGTGLSGGEGQLLAFARVLLCDPDLVILDEATSRLDPATERQVEKAVTRLLSGRTAVVIAHRLRTVMRADEIVILEAGRIVEHGTREALAADPASRFSRLLRVGMEEVLA